MPTITEKPVKSLECWYDATLKDVNQVIQLRQDTIRGLERINKFLLSGRLMHWCLQIGLLPWLMWPLTIYVVPVPKVDKLERVMLVCQKVAGSPKVSGASCFQSCRGVQLLLSKTGNDNEGIL